jgi:hypothetical protein
VWGEDEEIRWRRRKNLMMESAMASSFTKSCLELLQNYSGFQNLSVISGIPRLQKG